MAVLSRFSNNSQSCIAAKRIFVADAIYDQFEKAFVKAVKALSVGDPLDPANKFGPLARPSVVSDTERQVAAALEQGGKLLAGGARLEREGNFYAPTVIAGLPHDAPIAREEFFGPVALLFTSKTRKKRSNWQMIAITDLAQRSGPRIAYAQTVLPALLKLGQSLLTTLFVQTHACHLVE